jgi:hypothetical protein
MIKKVNRFFITRRFQKQPGEPKNCTAQETGNTFCVFACSSDGDVNANMSLVNMTTNDTMALMNMTDYSNHNNMKMDGDTDTATMIHTGTKLADTPDHGTDPTEAQGSRSSNQEEELFCIGGMHSTHSLLCEGSNGMVMYMDGTCLLVILYAYCV